MLDDLFLKIEAKKVTLWFFLGLMHDDLELYIRHFLEKCLQRYIKSVYGQQELHFLLWLFFLGPPIKYSNSGTNWTLLDKSIWDVTPI